MNHCLLIFVSLGLVILVAGVGCSRPRPSLDAQAQAERLGRGVNLGNALEAPAEGEWGMVIEADFFSKIREAGFDTVRVPIRWSAHAMEKAPYTVDETFFDRIDWVIAHALEADLNVVINMHHYDALFETPDDHADRFVVIWEQIARRYASQSSALYFEFLNEPHGNLDAGRWNRLFARTLEAVRAIDAHHTVIVDAANWGNISGLRTLMLPEGETNLIATFHYYEPFLFTHQGAEWVGPEYGTTGVMWPGPPEEAISPIPAAREVAWVHRWFTRYNETGAAHNPAGPRAIEQAFDDVVHWRESRGVPVWLGEFGAYSTADMASRVRWTAFVREQAEAREIPWAYWEFGAGFGIYDREAETWRDPLLHALVPADLDAQ
jgi:endoglucanase